MCDGIINSKGIVALIGVIVGFLLSEGANAIKKGKERKESKISLFDEVRFNQEQTRNKIEIIDDAINALKEEKFLSTKCARYSIIEFENLYRIALPNLSIIERDNLRHLNGVLYRY